MQRISWLSILPQISICPGRGRQPSNGWLCQDPTSFLHRIHVHDSATHASYQSDQASPEHAQLEQRNPLSHGRKTQRQGEACLREVQQQRGWSLVKLKIRDQSRGSRIEVRRVWIPQHFLLKAEVPDDDFDHSLDDAEMS